MKDSTLVKIRRNIHNKDVCMGVPQAFKENIREDEFFECSISDGALLYRPVRMSGAVPVVETDSPASNQQPEGADHV